MRDTKWFYFTITPATGMYRYPPLFTASSGSMRDTKRFYFTITPATGIHPYSQHPVGPWGTPNSFTSPLPQLQVSTGIHPYSQHPVDQWGTQQCRRDQQRQTRACCWWCWTPPMRMPWCLGVLRLAQRTRWTLTWQEPPAALASELSPQPLWRRQANAAGVTISSIISYLRYAKITRFFYFHRNFRSIFLKIVSSRRCWWISPFLTHIFVMLK